jgi:hypothetical protein
MVVVREQEASVGQIKKVVQFCIFHGPCLDATVELRQANDSMNAFRIF